MKQIPTIRYRLNPVNGRLMRTNLTMVEMLLIIGASLLFMNYLGRIIGNVFIRFGVLESQHISLTIIWHIGIAVLLLDCGYALYRVVIRLCEAGSLPVYFKLRKIERQTHRALTDSAVANTRPGTKFIEVSQAVACFDEQSGGLTIKINKLAGQQSEELEKFADILSSCLIGINRSLFVKDYSIAEDKTTFTYLLDDIVQSKARRLLPHRIEELRTDEDYEILVEKGLKFSMLHNHHCLLVGPTGSSKTTLLKSILSQVFMFQNEVDITICDTKSEFSSWQFLPSNSIISNSKDIVRYFEELLELVIEREKTIAYLSAKHDLTGATFADFDDMGMKLCIIEEYSALLLSLPDSKTRNHVQALVQSIVSRSRSSGIWLCICLQQPNAQILGGTALRDCLGVRICLSNGSISDELARMVFGGNVDLIDNHVERFSGYIQTTDNQMSQPRHFYNINLHEHGLEKISTFRHAYEYGKQLRDKKL